MSLISKYGDRLAKSGEIRCQPRLFISGPSEIFWVNSTLCFICLGVNISFERLRPGQLMACLELCPAFLCFNDKGADEKNGLGLRALTD